MTPPTPWERIMKVYDSSSCDSVSDFARALGLNRAENLFQIKRGNNGISLKLAEMIHKKYRRFSTGWLMTGEGSPYVDGAGPEFQTIPYYINFSRNNLNDNPDGAIPISRTFFPDADYATIIKGDWLEPRIPAGSLIMLKNSRRIIYGGHYYIELSSGETLYRIIRKSNSDSDDFVKLLSVNLLYDEIEIPRKEITGFYKIVGSVSNI